MKRVAISGMFLAVFAVGLGAVLFVSLSRQENTGRSSQTEKEQQPELGTAEQFSSLIDDNKPEEAGSAAKEAVGSVTPVAAPKRTPDTPGEKDKAHIKETPQRVRNLLVDAYSQKPEPAREVHPSVVRRRPVRVDLDQLRPIKSGCGDILELRLFDDVSLEAVIDSVEKPYGASILYKGRLLGDKLPGFVTVVVNEGVLIANILTPKGELYEIRYLGDGIHEVQEIDQSKLPRCGGALISEDEASAQQPVPASGL